MNKVCSSCGFEIENSQRPPEEAEDCPSCGELGSAVAQEETENEAEEGE